MKLAPFSFLSGLALLAAAVTSPAQAADIALKSMYYSVHQPVPLISYDGDTVSGDVEAIKAIVESVIHCGTECAPADGQPIAVVSLNGPGGNYQVGLELAQYFRSNHIATVVEDGNWCMSACAFAFLGGSAFSSQEGIGTYVDRVAAPGSIVGFHAPYFTDDALNRYIEELGAQIVMGDNRTNYALMVEELVNWNINPNIIGWMVFQGPDETYDLQTPTDLYLTRTALPASNANLWIGDKPEAVRNACLRLLAQYHSSDPAIEHAYLTETFSKNTGVNEFGKQLSGYQISSEPLRVGHCSVTTESLATDGDFDIALYLTAGITGQSRPVLSFFNRNDGWSTIGVGGNPTRRVFQKGSINHMFLPPNYDLNATPELIRLSLRSARFETLQAPDMPAIAADLTVTDQGENFMAAANGDVRVFVQSGPAVLFETARMQGMQGVNVSHESVTDVAFIRKGTYQATGHPFTWMGFANDTTSTIIRIESAAAVGAPWTSEQAALVRQIECSATFADLKMAC